MKKIHITLVGGQPAPVYQGIRATEPDKIIYIYSDESKEVLDNIKKEINIDSNKLKLDVTDPTKIKKRAEELAKKYANDEVTVNISSGLKSWSHWFSVIFDKYENASVVYIDQNNLLWNYRSMESFECSTIDMLTLFRLYGNSIDKKNYTPLESYTKEDYDAVLEIEKIRKINYPVFNRLTILDNRSQNILRNQKNGSFKDHATNSEITWDKDSKKVELKIVKKNQSHRFDIYSPHSTDLIFSAGWFELKIAKMLSKWNKAKEIYLNCRFQSKDRIDKNEVDILVYTGSKILFVECKTQITNNTDIDKFRSVIKGYGGTGSKGLFITDAKMSNIAKEKCEERNILSFSLQDEHLDLSQKEQVKISPEDALYRLLDDNLKSINTR